METDALSSSNAKEKPLTCGTVSPKADSLSLMPAQSADNEQLALVLKHNDVANVLALNNIKLGQKISFNHQLFILSLIEYICNLLNLKDKPAADRQFLGYFFLINYFFSQREWIIFS